MLALDFFRVIFGRSCDPFLPEVVLIERVNAQRIVLIDIILFKLVQHDQYEQLQEHLLPEELKGQPEQDVKWGCAISAATALRVPRSGREEHEEVPVLAGKVDEEGLNGVVEVLVVDDRVEGLRVVAVEIAHQVWSKDRSDEKEKEENGESLADGWQREHEGFYQLLEAFEALKHAQQSCDSQHPEDPGYLRKERQSSILRATSDPQILKNKVKDGGWHHKEVKDVPNRKEISLSKGDQLDGQLGNEDIAEDRVERVKQLLCRGRDIIITEGHDHDVEDNDDSNRYLKDFSWNYVEKSASNAVGGRYVQLETRVFGSYEDLKVFPVDLAVAQGLGPNFGLWLVVIGEENADKQVHKEKRADEDEENSICKVENLAVIAHWSSFRGINEGINIERPVFPRRKDIERYHRGGHILKVD